MRILIVTQYFWPENFKINDIAVGLKEKGHKVEVLTCKPNYPSGKFNNGYTFFNRRTEFWNNIKIYRSSVIPRGSGKGFILFLNYIFYHVVNRFFLLFRILTFLWDYPPHLWFRSYHLIMSCTMLRRSKLVLNHHWYGHSYRS